MRSVLRAPLGHFNDLGEGAKDVTHFGGYMSARCARNPLESLTTKVGTHPAYYRGVNDSFPRQKKLKKVKILLNKPASQASKQCTQKAKEPTLFSLFNIAATVSILSRDEQTAHALAFQQTRDQKHIDALVRSNMRMAIKIARRHYRNHLEMDDLIAEAITGIMRAAETFDADGGASFTSYATQWMRAAVQSFVQANTGAIRCGSRTAKALWASLARVRREHGMDATPEVIAEALKLDVDEVKALLPTLTARATSIDSPVGDADGATIGELIPSEAVSQDEMMDRTQCNEALVEALSEFATTLNDRHADILQRRVLADYFGTDKATPADFGVTKQRVSQLDKVVTKKLQAFLVERFGAEGLKGMMG